MSGTECSVDHSGEPLGAVGFCRCPGLEPGRSSGQQLQRGRRFGAGAAGRIESGIPGPAPAPVATVGLMPGGFGGAFNQSPCPCGGVVYRSCCGPLHRGDQRAETAEQLMRSRYSAFARGEIDYLLATHPEPDVPAQQRRRSLERSCRQTRCLLYTSPSPRDRQKSRMPSSA